eukprot:5724617-Pyramimonas_sp.AAC.4
MVRAERGRTVEPPPEGARGHDGDERHAKPSVKSPRPLLRKDAARQLQPAPPLPLVLQGGNCP